MHALSLFFKCCCRLLSIFHLMNGKIIVNYIGHWVLVLPYQIDLYLRMFEAPFCEIDTSNKLDLLINIKVRFGRES